MFVHQKCIKRGRALQRKNLRHCLPYRKYKYISTFDRFRHRIDHIVLGSNSLINKNWKWKRFIRSTISTLNIHVR